MYNYSWIPPRKRENNYLLGISHFERDNWAIRHGHRGFFSGNIQITDEVLAFFASQACVHPDVPNSRFRWTVDSFDLKEEIDAIEMTTR